ncbi:MAG: C39 family peptidase [Candidatus Saccharibacteria bacterium]
MIKLTRKKCVGIAIAVVIVIILAIFSMVVLSFSEKSVSALGLQYNSVNQAINEPLVIKMNKKIRDVDIQSIVITPKIKGKWEFKRGDILQGDELLFRPDLNFQVNTKYEVSSINIQRWVFGSVKLSGITVTTEPAPGLTNTGLIALPSDSTIAADYKFSLSAKHSIDLQIKTNPLVKFTRKSVGDNSYTWQSETLLPQGQTLTIDIYDAKTNTVLATKSVKVAAEPKISFNKSTYFSQNDVAQITFSDAIKSPASDSITFDIAGSGSWKSPTEYDFIPTNVSPGMTYNYKVKGNLRTQSGGILTQDFNGSFSTTGAVFVVGSSPGGLELAQSSELISFSFDQPVEKASVEQRFSISSGIISSVYWQDDKTFFAKVVDLGYQRTFTATIAAGVKNAGFGLPSIQAFNVSFTTEARITKYDVPFYKQQHTASCAAASLRMILVFKGVSVGSDMEVVQRMGYSPRPMDKSTDPPIWDDPGQMFVGDINGSLSKGTAAGPDAGPVVKAAQSYGRGSSFVTGASVNWIASQLNNGHLVVMFGALKNTNNFITWQTSSGGTARMNTSSHARAVVGVKGEPNAPIGFWVNDPYLSSTQYWTASQLQENINLDAYQQAVEVE